VSRGEAGAYQKYVNKNQKTQNPVKKHSRKKIEFFFIFKKNLTN
jgi:hypothetical protein